MSYVNSYDAVLYRGYPFPQTHPARLATIAHLFGMNPAPIDSCRVLELGCGDGANLIPMAVHLPEGEFVGIDSAARPIANGAALIGELGLKNIVLHERNLLGVSADFGQFDYIIAHGLYSWVPQPVRDKILSICKINLARQGVAFISYNTYPGGHMRQMIRQMMLIHVCNLNDAQERIDQARALLHFLAESQPTADAYANFVKKELEFVQSRADEAIYHDDLAEINSPVYFGQFVEHAVAHGLQYLSEAYLSQAATTDLPVTVSTALKQGALSRVAQEQYLDFVTCRKFRQTLLCHKEYALDLSPKPERLRNLHVASSARPLSDHPEILAPGGIEKFRVTNGGVISIDFPLAKAALLHLSKIWPASERFDRLVAQSREILGEEKIQDENRRDEEIAKLSEFLLAGYGSDMVELSLQLPHYVTTVSERPMASALARLQASQCGYLTSPRHTMIDIKDSLARRLVMSLDGTREHATLLRELNAALRSGELPVELTAPRHDTPASTFDITADELEQKLSELAHLALFVA